MVDLTIGYIGTRGAGEFDNSANLIDTYENDIRCICKVTPSTYDCDGAYMEGNIQWRFWKTPNNTDEDATAMDEDAVELFLFAPEDGKMLQLYICDWGDWKSSDNVRDVFVLFPLADDEEINVWDEKTIKDVLFENALAQARSIRMLTHGNNLREELLNEARERIDITATLKGLGYVASYSKPE